MIPISWAYCCSQVWCMKRLTFCKWLQISGIKGYGIWYCCAVLSSSVTSESLRPQWTAPHTRLLYPWQFSRQEYWSGLPCPPPGDLPNPGIEPRSPTLQMDSLPSEPPGKTKNTGVGSLSLLHGIFPTQESNRGLLHCRRIFLPAELSGKPNGIWCNQSKWLNFIANFLSMPIKFAIIQQNHKDRKEQSLFYIKFRWYSRNKMPNGNCDRSMAELLRDTLQVESLYRPVTLFIILKCDQVGEGWVTLTRGRQGRWVWLPPQWSS